MYLSFSVWDFICIYQWELRIFSVGFPVSASSSWQASVRSCVHVYIARYVFLINLITSEHAQREREDIAKRPITLSGFSFWLSVLFLFEVLLCIPSLTPLSHSFMWFTQQHISPNNPHNKHIHIHTNMFLYCITCYERAKSISLSFVAFFV